MCTISREIQFYHHRYKNTGTSYKNKNGVVSQDRNSRFSVSYFSEKKSVDYYMYLGHSLKYF